MFSQHQREPEREWNEKHGINTMAGVMKNTLGKERLHYGSNSGFQAINLAYLLGAKRIFLLGYNMCIPKGESVHFFGGHPKGWGQGSYRSFVTHFTPLARDLEKHNIPCINLTDRSKLHQFIKEPLEAFL